MVREVEVSSIKEATYNPRVQLHPGMPEWERLRKSIEQFGNVEPIVWNAETGNLVGGHQRLAVLKSLGYTQVPCSVVNLCEADEKLLNIALNKIKGEWDHDKLGQLLSNFDRDVATVSGFSAAEIAVMLASNDDIGGGLDGWDDVDWGSDEQMCDEQDTGSSYVVTLVFPTVTEAKAWADGEGYTGRVKPKSNSTVIRVEG